MAGLAAALDGRLDDRRDTSSRGFCCPISSAARSERAAAGGGQGPSLNWTDAGDKR